MKDTITKEFKQIGNATLTTNKSGNDRAPQFTGTLKVDSEQLQKLIDKSYGNMVMLPLSMWLKDSQWNDEQYVSISTSVLVDK